MKKWMIGFLISVFAITASLFAFVPGSIAIKKSILVKISPQAISRILIENGNWNKGWQGIDSTPSLKDSGQTVYFNGNTYSVADRKYSSLLISIQQGNNMIATSSLNIISISKVSVELEWVAIIPTSSNPVKRLKRYQQAKKIENDLAAMLNKMETYFSTPANVYGITIWQEAVVDSTLLSTYDSCKGHPDVAFIYSMISTLKNYISSLGAKITGYPMLNIYTRDSLIYLVKVALPVDRKLPTSGKMTYKWMLPGGNILVTEVKGDSKAIDRAFLQMEYFLKDYGRHAPAIPFLSLVTDRMQEKDSTQWLTRIYYPVME